MNRWRTACPLPSRVAENAALVIPIGSQPAPVPVRGEGDHPGSRRPVPSRFVCWRPVGSSCELRGRVRGLENCAPSEKCLYLFIV